MLNCKITTFKLDEYAFTTRTSENGSNNKFVIDRPIMAVFDTGLTGCALSQPLWEYIETKLNHDNSNKQLSTIKSIDIGMQTKLKNKLQHFKTNDTNNPLCNLSCINLDWFDDNDDDDTTSYPCIIAIGQMFLTYGCLTIDIDNRQATFV